MLVAGPARAAGRGPCAHAAPQRQRRRRPVRAVQLRGDAPRGNHVHQRIPVGELVEMHGVDCRAVHARLGVGQQFEQRQRMDTRPGRQRRAGEPVAQTGVCGAACAGARPGKFAPPLTTGRQRVWSPCLVNAECEHAEAAAGRGTKRRSGSPVDLHGRKVGKQRRAECGQRIDHRSDEHVTADASDKIEMDRERRRRRQCRRVSRRRGRHRVLRE